MSNPANKKRPRPRATLPPDSDCHVRTRAFQAFVASHIKLRAGDPTYPHSSAFRSFRLRQDSRQYVEWMAQHLSGELIDVAARCAARRVAPEGLDEWSSSQSSTLKHIAISTDDVIAALHFLDWQMVLHPPAGEARQHAVPEDALLERTKPPARPELHPLLVSSSSSSSSSGSSSHHSHQDHDGAGTRSLALANPRLAEEARLLLWEATG